MIILNTPQGTLEWLTNRLWRLTASEMGSNITATGKLSESKAALKSIDRLIAGIELANVINKRASEIEDLDDWKLKKFMSHYTGDSFAGSVHTERGHECEPDALAALSEKIGEPIVDVGMCVMGDNPLGVVSCSPDGLVYRGRKINAGCEVKSPCLCNWYNQVAADILPDDYKMQCHAGMAICDVDVWHFGSYFRGKPLFYKRVERESYTDTLQESLIQFADLYRARYEEVTAKAEALKAEKEMEEVA